MTDENTLRLGTRGSKLARWQADWVASQLTSAGFRVEMVLISTKGDVTTGPLGAAGGIGLFTKEIQRALLADEIDLAVHSLKDLPTDPVPGLKLGAVPPRESNRDAFVSEQYADLASLPEGARIGTGSIRRRAQLLYQRQDLQVLDIRGNVDTRLSKLDDGEYDAIVLAEAGLKRLGLTARIASVLDRDVMLPAVGQGALGVEIRADDQVTADAVQVLDDESTHHAVIAERAMLAALRGGCLAPVGAWARETEDGLQLDGAVFSADGKEKIIVAGSHPTNDPGELGRQVAEQLVTKGAAKFISQSRETT